MLAGYLPLHLNWWKEGISPLFFMVGVPYSIGCTLLLIFGNRKLVSGLKQMTEWLAKNEWFGRTIIGVAAMWNGYNALFDPEVAVFARSAMLLMTILFADWAIWGIGKGPVMSGIGKGISWAYRRFFAEKKGKIES